MKRITTGHAAIPLILAGAASVFLLIGCAGDTGPTSPADDPIKAADFESTGLIQLTLIDAPAVYDQVVLMLDGISAHRASGDSLDGWYGLDFEPAPYDLLDLTNGVSALLTQAALPTGHYNQIRLHLAEGSYIVVDGENFDLRVPSGLKSGLKIHHEFDIVEGETYSVTLDFDAGRSVKKNGRGRYSLTPVIRAQADESAGAIMGRVDPANARAMITTVAGPDSVSTFADPETGEFMLSALPAGTYAVCFEATADGPWPEINRIGVDVEAGTTTDLGVVLMLVPLEPVQ